MNNIQFPKINKEIMLERLSHPSGTVRLLIDTDAANEIDDQYALAWALLSPEKINVEAVTAEPFSFAHHQKDLIETEMSMGLSTNESLDRKVFSSSPGWIQDWVQRLHDKGLRANDVHFVGPSEGMELSYQEILTIYKKLDIAHSGKVFRGSETYLNSLDKPIKTEASEVIIDLAKSGNGPLHIAALGCVTNIASALIMAPEIIKDIVVIWTSSFPSLSPHCNRPSLNLVQDVIASQLIFDSGVPHVYLPGYQVGTQLKISLPEMELFVKGKGEIGDYLYYLYTHNPLHERFATTDTERRTWVIWDIINIAWLLNPNWVHTFLTSSPILNDELYWEKDENRHLMLEGYELQRDEIFLNFYDTLKKAK